MLALVINSIRVSMTTLIASLPLDLHSLDNYVVNPLVCICLLVYLCYQVSISIVEFSNPIRNVRDTGLAEEFKVVKL